MATSTRAKRPTTIGHPYRDPDTGLVPEQEAYDPDWADDEGFGDGTSLVGVGAEVAGRRLHLVGWIRPNERQAPKDSCGRPMTGYLAQGFHETYDLGDETSIGRAVDDLVGMGVTATYAAAVIARAVEKHDALSAQQARITGLVAALEQEPQLLASVLDEVEQELAVPGRATARMALVAHLAEHPDDLRALRREITRRGQ